MVSVIIPAYNAQAYLGECLESVLAQSFYDWEAIVVDDGSTDCTFEIAQKYSALDRRIRVLSTDNKGVSSARNSAISCIKGEWFTFLDSDDMLYPYALRAMLDVAEGADVICGGCERGDTVDDTRRNVNNVRHRVVSGAEALKEGLYQTGIQASACAKLYKTDVFRDVMFHADIRYEDLLYYCDVMIRASQVRVIDVPVYFYRDHSGSFVNTMSSDRLDVLNVVEMIEERFRHDAGLSAAAHDRRLSADFNMYGLLSVHDRDGRYSEVKKRCWEVIKRYRFASLLNPEVRLKNKAGILVSCLGGVILALVSRLVYR